MTVAAAERLMAHARWLPQIPGHIMSAHSPRQDLVARLVAAQFPLAPILRELARLPWDCEKPLVVLEREHVAAVLGRYLRGELTAADVSAWAEAVEVREDIELAEPGARELGHTLFVLANPAVDGELSMEKARSLPTALDRLRDGAGDR